MIAARRTRPYAITALVVLFAIGTAASFISVVSLIFPGSFLEPVWRLNPKAREGFTLLGPLAVVLMSVVCLACTLAAIGLWRVRRWAYWLALIMLIGNLAGDLANVATGSEPRAIIGIPIVLLVLTYLLHPRTRENFKPNGGRSRA